MTTEMSSDFCHTSVCASSFAGRTSRTLALSLASIVPALAFSPVATAQTITPTTINTITVAPNVFGISLSPDGKSMWVAGYNNTTDPGFTSLIDVASQAVGSSIPVGVGPADISFTSTGGRAFVTNLYGSTLSVVDVPALRIQQTVDLNSTPNPFGSVYESGHLFVTSLGGSKVPNFTTGSPVVLQSIASVTGESGRPALVPTIKGMCFSGDVLIPVYNSTSGHPSLFVVDHGTSKVATSVTLPSSAAVPQAVVVSPNGKYAYVSLFDSTGAAGGVWVVNLQTLKTVTVINTGDTANYGEAISEDGKYLLVAGFLQNQVALIATATNTLEYIIQAGDQPNAIALTKDDSEAFITNQTDGTVTVVAFSPSL